MGAFSVTQHPLNPQTSTLSYLSGRVESPSKLFDEIDELRTDAGTTGEPATVIFGGFDCALKRRIPDAKHLLVRLSAIR